MVSKKDNVKQFYNLLSFTRQLESKALLSIVWMFILVVILVFGFIALRTQIIKGHEITGMRDHVVWGVYIVNFVFFMGISYAGAIFSGLLAILNVSWRSSIIRITQLVSVICGLIGPLYILLCLGRIDRVFNLFIYGRIPSPIIWDIFAIITYLVGNIAFLYLLLIPDLAYLRDTTELRLAKWRKRMYAALSLNYKDTPEQKKNLRVALRTLAITLIPIGIILTTIMSWIFGLTLRPGWSSTMFGPYFVFSAFYSGIALIIIIMWVFRNRYSLEDYLTDEHFRIAGIIMIVIGCIYAYFSFNEYFSLWYSFKKWDARLVKKLLDLSQYGWMFIFANFVGIVIPVLIVSVKRFRTTGSIAFASVIIVLGIWVRRYIGIIPTLETPLFPIQDNRSDYVHYTATWPEWFLTLSGIALFLFLLTVITKLIPIVKLTPTLDKEEGSDNE